MDQVEKAVSWSFAHPLATGAVAIVALVLSTAVYYILASLVRPHFSSLRDVPGPPRDHLLWGNVARILQEEPAVAHKEWQEKYGSVARYHGFFGAQRLVLYDPAALNHVLLSNCYDYPKPEEVRGDLAMILGKGILFAEGDDHRRQRRIMNPSFGPAHLRELTPVFFEHSHRLREVLTEAIEAGQVDETGWRDEEQRKSWEKDHPDGEIVHDVIKWLNRVTLDIIGDAGFGYQFGALEKSDNALGRAFSHMFSPRAGAHKPTPFMLVRGRFIGYLIRALPVLKIAEWIPNERIRQVREGFRVVQTESENIIRSKQDDVVAKDGLDSTRGSKDLIALLLKSVQSEGKSSMTNEELRGQLTTFLLAGHETTSTALTWTLHILANKPGVQEKLRKEVRDARAKAKSEGREELEHRELDSLPYLDGVTREVLRLESPVTATIRHAARDDIIPLSTPIPSASDPSRTISHLRVTKGQDIFIPIRAVNASKRIFGPDAEEFRPERWVESDAGTGWKIEGGVGVTSNILTFLAGPRSCIGYKFALVEFKAILSVLIDAFEFSPRDSETHVERRSVIVTRPLLVGEEDHGNKMPLRIRLAKRDD
ncbi:cytochrome P450 [Rhodotorula paludigena]|uniref:cytochrome P450 n=1 Tax=Rhodotorula paludigena TaxID=86838 RepID=UPI003178B1AD